MNQFLTTTAKRLDDIAGDVGALSPQLGEYIRQVAESCRQKVVKPTCWRFVPNSKPDTYHADYSMLFPRSMKKAFGEHRQVELPDGSWVKFSEFQAQFNDNLDVNTLSSWQANIDGKTYVIFNF